MILSRAISSISVRTSCFWFGSRPSVGSSRISTARVVQDRLRQPDAAAEALRQRLDRLFEHRLELQAPEHVVEARPALRARQAAQVGDEAEEARGPSSRRSSARLPAGSRGRRAPRPARCRRRGRRSRRGPEVGATKPASMRMVVDLPAPLGPRKPSTSPGPHVEADVLDGGDAAVALGETVGLDHVGRIEGDGRGKFPHACPVHAAGPGILSKPAPRFQAPPAGRRNAARRGGAAGIL